MNKLQKYIAVLSLMIVVLNFTSIVHTNMLASSFELTAFAEDGDDAEDEDEDEEEEEFIEGCEIPDPDAEGGVRPCTEEDYRTISNQVQAFAEESALTVQDGNYTGVLGGLDTCLPTDPIGANEVCDPDLVEEGDVDDRSFRRLLRSLANDELRTMLEEPLGTENIYKRARVCKTKFLKDKWGRLQPVNRSDNLDNPENMSAIIEDYQDSEIVVDEDGVIDADASRVDVSSTFFQDREFLITTGECEEFFVLSCRPRNMGQTSIGGTAALPIYVSCDQVQVLFSTSGAGLIKSYVGLVYRWAAGIIGVIAVLVMVINGIMISNSGGDQGKIDSAKGRIVQSLIALALLFLSGILLNTVNPNFFTDRDLQESPVETEEASDEPSEEPTE